MNAVSRVNGVRQAVSAFWGERNRREQNMLIAAVTVIVVGLIYVLLVDPAISGRAVLEKQLPVLRQQAAEVQALAKQAAGGSPKETAPPQPMTRESLEAALSRKGLKPENLTVAGESAKVQFKGVSFAALVDWLAEMQGSARISVLDANIEAQEQQDMVNASLTLRQQRSE